MNKLPIYELFYIPNIDSKNFIESVSLVEDPAIEANFIYFDKEEVKMTFSSDEEMIVKGPALIPNQLIYRSGNNKPRYIYFSVDTIKKFAMSFLSKKNQRVNVDHSNLFIDTNIVESYFVTDVNNEFNVPVGSWIVSMHINDKKVWNDIKNGKYKGFSIQGMFAEELEDQFNKQEKLETNMTLKEQLINAINKILFDEPSTEEPQVIPSGETEEQFAEEEVTVKPLVEKEPEVKDETIVVDEPKTEEPVVEEPKKEITIESVEELIIKSQEETIKKLENLIADLNTKIEKIGNTPVETKKEKESVTNLPTSFSNPATRFVSKNMNK